MKKMETQVRSTPIRIILRTGVLLFLFIYFSCLTQAQWAPTSTNSNDIHNTNVGNVGIGTDTPGAGLHIRQVSTSGGVIGGYVPLIIEDPTAIAGQNKFAFVTRYTDSANGSVNNLGIADLYAGQMRFAIAGNGNVGIGTTSPAGTLHVAGTSSNTARVIIDDLSNSVIPTLSFRQANVEKASVQAGRGLNNILDFFTGGGNRMTIDGIGHVGIGTSSPSQMFHIFANSGPDLVSYVQNTGGRAVSRLDSNSGSTTEMRLAQAGTDVWSMLANGSSLFLIRNEATGHYPFSINSSEYVGIGMTNPTHTLDVLGTINASGAITGNTINATYQDVAEWVPSSQKLSAGTVVVLDTSKSNHVLASSSSYDTKVAGVISAQPGISLGTADEDKVLVATTGRVKVKVDATTAPIHVGDLLVTSDNEGVAMKSEPIVIGGRKMHAPGTIVGKALEPLEKGSGEILVLLSLQ